MARSTFLLVGTVLATALVAPSFLTAAGPTLRIYPADVTVLAGRQVRFTAVTELRDDDAFTAQKLVWRAAGGSIDDDGLFRAGSAAGEFPVTVASGDLTATAQVRVRVPVGVIATAPHTQGHITVKYWRHGRMSEQGATAEVVARAFGRDVAEIRLVAGGAGDAEALVAMRRCGDRSFNVLRGVYDPARARWLELRLVDSSGIVIDRVRRLI